jgi:hypothetical protein
VSTDFLDILKAMKQKREQAQQATRDLSSFERQHPAAKAALDALSFIGADDELLSVTVEDGKAVIEVAMSEYDDRFDLLHFAGYDGDTGVWERSSHDHVLRCRLPREVSQRERHVRALWDGAKFPHCNGGGKVIPTDFPTFRRALLGVRSQASRRRRAAP